MVLGDFNCIRSLPEKKGGVHSPTRFILILEYNEAIENAGLLEPRWEVDPFT